MTDLTLKYIIPKLNTIANEVAQNSNTNVITASFCVAGCNTVIGVDSNLNPIYSSSKPLAYSYDGITYIASSNTTLFNINKVDFNGYQWIAGGQSISGTQSLLLSSDGINWITPVNNVLPGYLTDVVWGQKKWVALGAVNNTSPPNRVAYSSDGMNWTLSTYNADNHVGFFSSVAYNGSYFIAGGFNHIAKSTDGITWTDVDVTSIIGAVSSVTWNGRIWVASGSNTSNAFAYSSNGSTWTAVNTGLMNSSSVVVYNGTQFLAAGTGYYRLASSRDGINWSGVMSYDNYDYLPGSITDITWNGIYWIVTTTDDSFHGKKIAYSSDLVNWTNSTSAGKIFDDVQYLNTVTSRNRKNYISTFTN
jgi:hypothetical protein